MTSSVWSRVYTWSRVCDVECAISRVLCRVCDVTSSVCCRVCDVECVMSSVWCRVLWCRVWDVDVKSRVGWKGRGRVSLNLFKPLKALIVKFLEIASVNCLVRVFTCPVSRFLSHISCVASPVSHLLSHISCLTSHVSRLLYQISCLTFCVSRLLSHDSGLLSPFSCLKSPVSRLLTHVSCLTSPVSHSKCSAITLKFVEQKQTNWTNSIIRPRCQSPSLSSNLCV